MELTEDLMQKTITAKQSIIAIISLIIIYYIFFEWLDLPIDTWAHQTFPGTWLYSVGLAIATIFKPAYWLMIAVISMIIGLMQYRKDKSNLGLIQFGGSIILAMVLGTLFKYGLARYRPSEWFNHQLYGFHFLSHTREMNGTPSGHTTAIFAALFAICRIRQKPALTVLLMIIAIIVGLSRIVVTDHYPSDVIFGAYLGILSVYWFEIIRSRYCPITRDRT
jgi:membrane-associated phospholipid phosphatase